MILNIAVAFIAAASFTTITIIIIKKLPVLSVIDTKKVPQEKESRVKNGIIESRLKRKSFGVIVKVKDGARPYYHLIRRKAVALYQRVIALEKKYQDKKKASPVTVEARHEQTDELGLILHKAEMMHDKNELRDAENLCIKAIGIDKNCLDAYHLLGDIYIDMKDYEHARQIFEFLIKMNARDHKAYSGLSQIAASVGNLTEAKADLVKSINLDKQVSSYHFDLARVCQAMDDSENAITCCQEALNLEPNNPKIINLLLQIALENKNKGLAIRTFDRLKKANPENKKLNDLKEQIDKI